jgi:hypothetical protein
MSIPDWTMLGLASKSTTSVTGVVADESATAAARYKRWLLGQVRRIHAKL